MAKKKSLRDIQIALRAFAEARDWEQFHSPKNLAAALVVEAGELLEHFQWLSERESRSLPKSARAAVRLEMADVLLYLIRLADQLDVDLVEAATEKLKINSKKYPVKKTRGRHTKYTHL